MKSISSDIDSYLKRLFPLNRSITGQANRETLKVLQELVPLEIKEIASGTEVYDWTIPQEWNARDAYIMDESGNRLVDFGENNLHLMSYSTPVDQWMAWEELEPHLHCHPDLPDAIPYRTSYYKSEWGFCVTKMQYDAIRKAGRLHVHIDTTLSSGSLTYGELLIPGKLDKEILLSCYICHPSMANDSLSGVILTAFLGRELLARQHELMHSFRIVFVPETIGAIAYCATHERQMKAIDAGFVITTVGGTGKFGYKQSFDSDHAVNAVVEKVFSDAGLDHVTYPFDIHGSDERQYSTQGFRINCVSITKDKYYEYPYYHSSLDDLNFVQADAIAESLTLYLKAVFLLDWNVVYRNRYPHCEVMLSKHDLYPETGGAQLPEIGGKSELDVRLWLLFLSDGDTSLFKISKRTGLPLEALHHSAQVLMQKGILELSDGVSEAE